MPTKGRGIIVGRRNIAQELCPRCGKPRQLHPRNLYLCDVDDEVIRILKLVRDAYGRTWRAEVLKLWALPNHCPAYLIPARQQIGPTRLRKIDLDRA